MNSLMRILTLRLHTDVAFSRDESGRFLPWIIALMVYLAALMLAGSFTLNRTIMIGRSLQTQSFSVHLPHMNEKDREVGDKILALIRGTPGIEQADVMDTARIQAMVEPWLGKSDSLSSLPLPVIIEGKAKAGASVDLNTMTAKIQLMVPGASLDDHKKWLEQFSNFVGVVQFTLLLIAILIISSTACIVIFACKTSLKIHRGTVALLHRLGAFDSYIATQFQNYAAALTLKGAFIGSGFASITLLFLHFIAHSIDSPLFPSFVLSPVHWLILFTLPLLMSGLALWVARMSVLTNLRRAP